MTSLIPLTILFLVQQNSALPLSCFHPDFISLRNAFSNVPEITRDFDPAGSCNHCALLWIWCYPDNTTRQIDTTRVGRGRHLIGTIDFMQLPITLNNLILRATTLEQNLTGTVSLDHLPALNYVDLSFNNFVGTFQIPVVSDQIRWLDLSRNDFTAIIFPQIWPSSFKKLILSELPQALSGPPTWISVLSNSSLTDITLTRNNMTGSIDLTTFPRSMERLHLGWNRLSEAIDLSQLPPNITSLYFISNPFESIVFPSVWPRKLRTLNIERCGISGLFPGPAFQNSNLEFLRMRFNKFSGPVDTSILPRSLRLLYISDNRFNGTFNTVPLGNLVQLTDIRVWKNHFVGPVRMDLIPSWVQEFWLDPSVFCDGIVCDPPNPGGITGPRGQLICGSRSVSCLSTCSRVNCTITATTTPKPTVSPSPSPPADSSASHSHDGSGHEQYENSDSSNN